VCRHEQRDQIELWKATGFSLDKIAAKFGVHRDSVHRHWLSHVPEARKNSYLIGQKRLTELSEIAAEESGSVLDHLKIMRSLLMSALSNSAKDGDYGRMAMLSPPLLRTLERLGDVTGEIARLSTSLTINNNATFVMSPAFGELQSGLLRICAAHPAARGDIISLLRGLDERFADAPAEPPGHMIACEPVEVARHVD